MGDRATSAEGGEPAPALAPRPWWERRWFIAALVLLSMVPLLYPPVPPLVDLPGHMGRYRVQLDLDTSAWLRQYYDFQWAAIGNLGVDLLIMPLAPIFGLELSVKLVVLAIPPLTVAGFLWVAREVHGRVPPTALFALPFAYSHPFMFGFVNYALSIALAFLGFALWLRLARLGRLRLRAILFVPISVVVFFAHTFGWGVLGLLCFSAEAVRQHDQGTPWLRSGVNAALHASVMALPLVIMLAWRSEAAGGDTDGWFDLKMKLMWVIWIVRDRWMQFDVAALVVCLAVIFESIRLRRFTLSRNLAFSALVLLACFVLLPWTVFGSAYADMRLIPFVFAVTLLAIRFRDPEDLKVARILAVLGLIFFLARIIGATASMALAADDQRHKLAALEQVPMGARVVSLVALPCNRWPLVRDSHLGGMVIVRRHGFSNDQWVGGGINPLQVRLLDVGPFDGDPSQLVRKPGCRIRGKGLTFEGAMRQLRRTRFDYLWLINLNEEQRSRLDVPGQQVWSAENSALYALRPGGRSSTQP